MSFVSVLNRVGEVELARGDLDAAQTAFEDFLAEAARLQEDLPEFTRSHRMLAVAHYKFGELHQARAKDLEGDAQKSELRLAKEAIERARAIFADMGKRGILSPSDAGVEDALTEEITALEVEIGG